MKEAGILHTHVQTLYTQIHCMRGVQVRFCVFVCRQTCSHALPLVSQVRYFPCNIFDCGPWLLFFLPIFISPVCSSHSRHTEVDQVQVSCAVQNIKTDGPKDQITKWISPHVCLGWDIYVGFIIINTEHLTWQTLFYTTVCPVMQSWHMLVQLQATLKHAPYNWITLAPAKVKLWGDFIFEESKHIE